jgi:hypothetical protein
VPPSGSLVVPGAIVFEAPCFFAASCALRSLYSRDPLERYVDGAGDGWLGAWNFMQRGRLVHWSQDGTRIRFLEHAATIGTYGDLTSVVVPSAAPLTLGLNVHAFDEIADHRVIAIENAVYVGTWNRLVVIDETARCGWPKLDSMPRV